MITRRGLFAGLAAMAWVPVAAKPAMDFPPFQDIDLESVRTIMLRPAFYEEAMEQAFPQEFRMFQMGLRW